MRSLCLMLLLWGTVNGAQAADQRNVLLICVDDLRPELGCYGKSYIHSPNIDELAARAVRFDRHYVQAPTCGASRYTLLTGRYGSESNGALFNRAGQIRKNPESVPPSMPAWFRQHGYTTVSIGKVSHHPGGRGGNDWDDDAQPEMPNSWDRHLMPTGPWMHPRGAMHGLAHGEIRGNAKQMDVFQSTEGSDDIYPDGLITNGALEQLDILAADERPFFLAVGLIRPHLPFGAPAKYMQHYVDIELPAIPHPAKPKGKTTWHSSGEFMKYNRWGRNPNDDAEFATAVRKHYAACVSYADAQVGRVLKKLDDLKLRDDTVIVLWGDHGWHLGEHAVWGKHTLFEESLLSPMLMSYSGMKNAGQSTRSIVRTMDIFPTLCELTHVEAPDFCQGQSLKPILDRLNKPGLPAVAYHRGAKTLRNDAHRIVVHKDGFVELYDHKQAGAETKNIAEDHPDVVKKLSAQLDEMLKR